jgi:uncharacterized protein YqhQ
MRSWIVQTVFVLRRALRLALLPYLQGSDEVLVGGQAVIEGVMMRSPHSFAVAVRRPAGSIAILQDSLERPSEKYRCLKYPVLRGLGMVGQALVLGIRALRYSAEQALEDAESKAPKKKRELSNWLLALNLIFSLGFFIFFYKFVPLYLTTQLKGRYPAVENIFLFNLVDGTIRILLFLPRALAPAFTRAAEPVFSWWSW